MGSEFAKALELALAKLASADRFESEIASALERKGFSDEIGAVLERLRSRRLVSDERVAEGVARARSGKRACGDLSLRAELTRRGAPAACIDAVLAQLPPERERAEAWLATLKPTLAEPARVARRLVGRGFSEETIREIVEPLLEAGESL